MSSSSSSRHHQSLYFLSLPSLEQLVCVTLTLQDGEEDLRSKQLKTCRELLLLYSDVLASPALESFTDITVVVAISFFQKGILQMFGQRHHLQLGSPQRVFPGDLQHCLSYSLISRLSPSWNKVGLYLISGKDFLTEGGRLGAVSMELSTTEGQLCIGIEANTVQLPPATLEDFDFAPLVLRKFCSDPDIILDPTSTGGAVWCHVLPSMKKGQIISISRQLPRDGPFRSYRDLQNHWNCLYGYRLPELAEEEVVYCSVYFRLVGERLFTYPLSCIRLQPVQRCPRVDLQGVLGSFLSDIKLRLQSVCGFPARLTSKPSYRAVSLNTATSVQVLNGLEINLTTSCSIRPVLTQLPPLPPPSQPPRSSFGSQPPAWTPLSQQDGAQDLLGNGCGFRGRLTQSQGSRGDGDWPPSSIPSSRAGFSFADSLCYQSQPFLSSSSSSLPVFQPASSLTSSSFSTPSSSLPVFQPASSVTSSISSSVVSLPLSQTPVNPAPRQVPIFRNRNPSRHINVALLRVQKKKKELSRGGLEPGRVTLPPLGKKNPTTAPSLSALSAASLPVLPPPTIPHFSRQSKLHSSSSTAPTTPTLAQPKIKHTSSLSPQSKVKPRIIVPPKPKPKSSSKTILKVIAESSAVTKSGDKMQEKTEKELSSETSSDTSYKETSKISKKRVVFDLKPKKSRAAVKDVNMEKMARSNQLSKLNSATLLLWLKARGISVSAKHRKEELMLKVMSCLAEA